MQQNIQALMNVVASASDADQISQMLKENGLL